MPYFTPYAPPYAVSPLKRISSRLPYSLIPNRNGPTSEPAAATAGLCPVLQGQGALSFRGRAICMREV